VVEGGQEGEKEGEESRRSEKKRHWARNSENVKEERAIAAEREGIGGGRKMAGGRKRDMKRWFTRYEPTH
jgi:hypothetical protein